MPIPPTFMHGMCGELKRITNIAVHYCLSDKNRTKDVPRQSSWKAKINHCQV